MTKKDIAESFKTELRVRLGVELVVKGLSNSSILPLIRKKAQKIAFDKVKRATKAYLHGDGHILKLKIY